MCVCVCVCVCTCCRSKERMKIYFKIGRSTKRFVFLKKLFILFLHSVIYMYVIFVIEHMWYKVLLMGYSMRLELTFLHSLNVFPFVCGFYTEVILPFS